MTKFGKMGSSNLPITDAVQRRTLDKYALEAKRIPLLTVEQEIELGNDYRNYKGTPRGEMAYKQLVASNLRLVIKIARQQLRYGANILDAIQEGNLGLMRAAAKWDPSRGVKFSSYAVYWIKAFIYLHVINTARIIRIGKTQAERRMFFQLGAVAADLSRHGVEPTNKALAEHFGVTEEDIQWMRIRISDSEVSMSAPIRNGKSDMNGEVVVADTIACEAPLPEDCVTERQLQQTLSTVVVDFAEGLSEKERFIFLNRIMRDEAPLTLQEVGDHFVPSVSRERVRQIEAKIVKKAEAFLRKRLGAEFTVELSA